MKKNHILLAGLTAGLASVTAAFMPSKAVAGCCVSPPSNSVDAVHSQIQSCNEVIVYRSAGAPVTVSTNAHVGVFSNLGDGHFRIIAGIDSSNGYSPGVRVTYRCTANSMTRSTPFQYPSATIDCATAGVSFAQCQSRFADDDPASGCNAFCD